MSFKFIFMQVVKLACSVVNLGNILNIFFDFSIKVILSFIVSSNSKIIAVISKDLRDVVFFVFFLFQLVDGDVVFFVTSSINAGLIYSMQT